MNLRASLFAAAASTALIGITAPAQAAALFSTGSSVTFDRNTTVKFSFVASHGAYQSAFGVYDSNKNLIQTLFTENQPRDPQPGKFNYNNIDSRGTCPTSVTPCETSFTFAAGISYFLGLSTQAPSSIGVVYSDNPIGPAQSNPAGFKFVTAADNPTYPTKFNPPNGANFVPLPLTAKQTGILVNDPWGGDVDGNDFVVKAEAVPEPATLAGLGIAAAGLISARRKRKDQKTA